MAQLWFDLVGISIPGVVSGFMVGKLAISKPYCLNGLRPSFWSRKAESMGLWDWQKLSWIAIVTAARSF
jgi:hypothetical protein